MPNHYKEKKEKKINMRPKKNSKKKKFKSKVKPKLFIQLTVHPDINNCIVLIATPPSVFKGNFFKFN